MCRESCEGGCPACWGFLRRGMTAVAEPVARVQGDGDGWSEGGGERGEGSSGGASPPLSSPEGTPAGGSSSGGGGPSTPSRQGSRPRTPPMAARRVGLPGLGDGHGGAHDRHPKKLLKNRLRMVPRYDGSPGMELEPMSKELNFDKGFYLCVRAIQLYLKHAPTQHEIIVVGVAGPSGAGKTVLATKLATFIPGSVVLSMDNYLDSAFLIDGNFDDPRLTDFAKLQEDLAELKRGRAADVPIYDFHVSKRTGATRVEPPESRVVFLEGIYALHEKVAGLIDLRIAVTGGVHFDLLKRVMRDTNRSGQNPQEIISQISETVYPMYKAYIEPGLNEAHIRIRNRFNPFQGLLDPVYVVKSQKLVDLDTGVKPLLDAATLQPEHTERVEEIYLLPPGEDPETCKDWLRMSNCDGHYTLHFQEWITDKHVIISPRVHFEVSVKVLGGLMSLGYTIGCILHRESRRLVDAYNTVKIDTFEQLGRSYMQLQGKDRARVEALGEKLGLQGTYSPRSYIEEIQRDQLALAFEEELHSLHMKISSADKVAHRPSTPTQNGRAGRRKARSPTALGPALEGDIGARHKTARRDVQGASGLVDPPGGPVSSDGEYYVPASPDAGLPSRELDADDGYKVAHFPAQKEQGQAGEDHPHGHSRHQQQQQLHAHGHKRQSSSSSSGGPTRAQVFLGGWDARKSSRADLRPQLGPVAATTDDDDDSSDTGRAYLGGGDDLGKLRRGGLARNFSDLSQKLGATLRLLEARSAADDVEQLHKAPTLRDVVRNVVNDDPADPVTETQDVAEPHHLERLAVAIEANTRALGAFLAAQQPTERRRDVAPPWWAAPALVLAGAGLSLAATWVGRPGPRTPVLT